MDTKRAVVGLLSVLLLVLAAAMVAAEEPGPSSDRAGGEQPPRVDPSAAAPAADPERKVILYYFHGKRRCNTCRTIEAYGLEAVEGEFADQLRSGELEWKVVNYDEPGNQHFLDDYELITSSLVVVESRGGESVRHKVLQQAWTLVRNKPAFIDYVRRSIRKYVG